MVVKNEEFSPLAVPDLAAFVGGMFTGLGFEATLLGHSGVDYRIATNRIEQLRQEASQFKRSETALEAHGIAPTDQSVQILEDLQKSRHHQIKAATEQRANYYNADSGANGGENIGIILGMGFAFAALSVAVRYKLFRNRKSRDDQPKHPELYSVPETGVIGIGE
ncbi:MAG TPA: hypothetical protein VLE69_03400 [Candidatus Saccharimonadales bacterium]|nr:hypothetical protein [Candidatus Saccharimonadales bacterium]